MSMEVCRCIVLIRQDLQLEYLNVCHPAHAELACGHSSSDAEAWKQTSELAKQCREVAHRLNTAYAAQRGDRDTRSVTR